MATFEKATKKQGRGRVALIGPAGSGKTMTALKMAARMAEAVSSRIAYIDTEHGSASKYSDMFDFDVAELDSFDPLNLVNYIHAAAKAGYRVLVIDSLSHFWMGKDGVLDQADRSTATNKFAVWKDLTPRHVEMIEAMLSFPGHIIVTLRSKVAYEVSKDNNGKTKIEKLGLQPVQREGVEYEFDVVADMSAAVMTIDKTRCPDLHKKSFIEPGEDVAEIILDWLKGDPEVPEEMRRTLHGIGASLYGDAWDHIRHALVAAYTNDRTASSADLKQKEAEQIIALLQQRQQFEHVGAGAYGDDWESKRAELCLAVSGGRTNSRDSLAPAQLERLISGMRDKLQTISGDGATTPVPQA